MNNDEKNQKADDDCRKAEELKSKNEFFSASFYYKNALKMYRESGNSAKQKVCKSNMLEANKKAVTEFKKIEIEQKIPKEMLERDMAHLNELMEGELPDILKKIGSSHMFFPKFKVVMETANKTMPLTASIASTATFDEKGNIVKGSDDGQQAWRMQIYEMEQRLRVDLYLKTIIKSLISMEKLNRDELIVFLESGKLIPEDDLKIIRTGMDAFFKEDYISALHILVPRLESLFLHLSKGLGIDTIGLNSGKEISTQTKTLSETHLDSSAFKDVWGEDLCEQLNFVLFRPLGYKLRHKIAHGEITTKECNFSNATLVLYFYIVILSRVRRTK